NACSQADIDRFAPGSLGVQAQQAKDLCNKAALHQALQYVFYGLGAASVGVGTYLLLTDGNAEKSANSANRRLEISPLALPGGGGFDVRVVY
ncbi:MAG: hypothetical protein FWD57_13825, partial [Polyangiaceae bacterium]|nr:hypothetical protein [Polyangiaceae bacterium]